MHLNAFTKFAALTNEYSDGRWDEVTEAACQHDWDSNDVPSRLDRFRDPALALTLDSRPPVFGDCYEENTHL